MKATPQNSRVGSQFGPYLLKRLLGRGGMGEVYEAEDTVKGRTVALKLLPDSLSQDPVFRERLQREARAAGRLQEPHVVPVHDFGEIDGQLFVDMRLIDGIDLRTLLSQSGPMPPARAVWIVRQIAAALDAAHAAGVTHRDVKPENILVNRDDFAYLVDFGIASAVSEQSLTEKGTAIGTYAYMAPERFSGGEVTHAADVYSLTCVLYQCLTASQPYEAKSISMVITAHLMEPPPRPSQVQPGIPPAFDTVVATGMAKSADDRYSSAGELGRAAAAAVNTTDVRQPLETTADDYPADEMTMSADVFRALKAPVPAPPPRPRRRARTAWVIGSAVAAVLVIAGGTIVWLRTQPSESTAAAVTPDERRLLDLIPDSGECTPNKGWPNAIAAVDCGPTSTSDVRKSGFFALYANADKLQAEFNAVVADDELTACPGGSESPTDWNAGGTSDQPEGRLACGTLEGAAEIVWTKTSDLVLGTAEGTDLDTLYQWWVDNAGPA